MNSHDVFADLKHYFGNGGYGKVGMRYSDRKAVPITRLRAVVSIKPEKPRLQVWVRISNKKAFAFDASYSQAFSLGETANEFVVGVDRNRFRSTNEQGRSTLSKSVALDGFRALPYNGILQNARAGNKGFNHSVTEENLDETGLYAKTVFRPLEGLSLVAGGRVGHHKIESGDGKTLHKASKTKFTSYAGAVYDIDGSNSLYASASQLYTPQTNLDADGNLLKPRQGNQFEVGYKGSHMDDRLNTRVSFYRMKDKKRRRTVEPERPQHSLRRIGRARDGRR